MTCSGAGYLCAAGVAMILVAATSRVFAQAGLVPGRPPRTQPVAMAGTCGARDRLRRRAPCRTQSRLCRAGSQDHGAAREYGSRRARGRVAPDPPARSLRAWLRAGTKAQCGRTGRAGEPRLEIACSPPDRGEASTVALELERLNQAAPGDRNAGGRSSCRASRSPHSARNARARSSSWPGKTGIRAFWASLPRD